MQFVRGLVRSLNASREGHPSEGMRKPFRGWEIIPGLTRRNISRGIFTAVPRGMHAKGQGIPKLSVGKYSTLRGCKQCVQGLEEQIACLIGACTHTQNLANIETLDTN